MEVKYEVVLLHKVKLKFSKALQLTLILPEVSWEIEVLIVDESICVELEELLEESSLYKESMLTKLPNPSGEEESELLLPASKQFRVNNIKRIKLKIFFFILYNLTFK